MHFKSYLLEQIQMHRAMQPQDIVKLCYQAAYGAEHLIENYSAAIVMETILQIYSKQSGFPWKKYILKHIGSKKRAISSYKTELKSRDMF